ncbi:MAG TPA: hypothetical protein VMZ91_12435 [Candidatus Paceibacterota bacterium]|nr:hypothetical protein [Candidatus Paceibacterota bacterium]
MAKDIEEAEEEQETDEDAEDKESEKSGQEKAESEEKFTELTELDENLEEIVPDVPENAIQENNFFNNSFSGGGGFVAPVLEATEAPQEIPALEEITQTFPTSSVSQDNEQEVPYSHFSQYETNEREYELIRQEETRFNPTNGLVADNPFTTNLILNPFDHENRDARQSMAQGNELEAFQAEQQKYRERIEEDTALPFRKKRGKTKGF